MDMYDSCLATVEHDHCVERKDPPFLLPPTHKSASTETHTLNLESECGHTHTRTKTHT